MSLERCIHEKWMRRAIRLASLGNGLTSPNPMVGAVILNKRGKLISEGFHEKAGMQHAEAMAFSNLKEDSSGGSIYVNLEPCCHSGRTPPCADKIIMSKIRRVFISIKDPDIRVAGKGISILEKAGIEVHLGICEKEALELNKSFIYRNNEGAAFGVLKWAMSIDGRLALKSGQSQWITNEDSRLSVHKFRAEFDAVVIGGNTLRHDNPLLTTRGFKEKEPLRVIFTRTLNLPSKSKLWDTKLANTLVVYDSSSANEKYLKRIPKNVAIEKISSDSPKLLSILLAKKGCNKILWECGPSLSSSAIKNGCIQEIAIYIAPKLLGGIPSMSPLEDLNFKKMKEVILLEDNDLDRFGNDIFFNAHLKD